VSITPQQIITPAFHYAKILKRPTGTPSANESTDGLTLLNLIVDEWSARKPFAYSRNFVSFTLTPGHQPTTIGPSGDIIVTVRPARIEQAALILTTSTPNVDVPLNIRDEQWWANERVKAQQSNVPTDLYYTPDMPNGSMWLWPVPVFAYGVRVDIWTALTQFAALNTSFNSPPAYQRALTLTLAEELCEFYERPVTPKLEKMARASRAVVMSNNTKSPRISSADHGAQGKQPGSFNYYTGS
jgi:hypothetical protein